MALKKVGNERRRRRQRMEGAEQNKAQKEEQDKS